MAEDGAHVKQGDRVARVRQLGVHAVLEKQHLAAPRRRDGLHTFVGCLPTLEAADKQFELRVGADSLDKARCSRGVPPISRGPTEQERKLEDGARGGRGQKAEKDYEAQNAGPPTSTAGEADRAREGEAQIDTAEHTIKEPALNAPRDGVAIDRRPPVGRPQVPDRR